MSFDIEVNSAEEGVLISDLTLIHSNCNGGLIETKKIDATIGKKYKNPKPKQLLELKCNSCYQERWISIPEGGSAKIISTAVDGQDREISAYKGRIESAKFRDLNNLIGEETTVKVVQSSSD